MKKYDRQALMEFAQRGGLLNIIYDQIPNGIIQDGEVERLGKSIYARIVDGRDKTNIQSVFEDIRKLGTILNTDVTPLLSPEIIHTDEYAIKPADLFGNLVFHSNVENLMWLAPNKLEFTATFGGRKQRCRVCLYTRDICLSTCILRKSLNEVNAKLGEWLGILHRLLATTAQYHYSISPALEMTKSFAALSIGAHIPGKKIQMEDLLYYTKQLILVGDKLEETFTHGLDLN